MIAISGVLCSDLKILHDEEGILYGVVFIESDDPIIKRYKCEAGDLPFKVIIKKRSVLNTSLPFLKKGAEIVVFGELDILSEDRTTPSSIIASAISYEEKSKV